MVKINREKESRKMKPNGRLTNVIFWNKIATLVKDKRESIDLCL